jgi:hypothetical protein
MASASGAHQQQQQKKSSEIPKKKYIAFGWILCFPFRCQSKTIGNTEKEEKSGVCTHRQHTKGCVYWKKVVTIVTPVPWVRKMTSCASESPRSLHFFLVLAKKNPILIIITRISMKILLQFSRTRTKKKVSILNIYSEV